MTKNIKVTLYILINQGER